MASLRYRHSSTLPSFQTVSFGVSPTLGRSTPAAYFTPFWALQRHPPGVALNPLGEVGRARDRRDQRDRGH